VKITVTGVDVTGATGDGENEANDGVGTTTTSIDGIDGFNDEAGMITIDGWFGIVTTETDDETKAAGTITGLSGKLVYDGIETVLKTETGTGDGTGTT
jgi:hypothetical protein